MEEAECAATGVAVVDGRSKYSDGREPAVDPQLPVIPLNAPQTDIAACIEVQCSFSGR